MARLTWGALDERFYETGVDRGVLYVDPSTGVAWNGLVSVSESPTGGDPKPAYLDGVKFRNVASSEEFEATIEAFSSPKEFGPCEGNAFIQNGLMATQQPRKSFSFSYRTKIGSASNRDLGYKIHFVYNALSSPASRNNTTLGATTETSTVSWSLTTRAPQLSGYKPTAHYIVDSRYTPKLLLQSVEDLLYGSEAVTSRLIMPEELVSIFNVPSLKLISIGPDTYELYSVEPIDSRMIMQALSPPLPGPMEEPILWLDTSSGDYAIPKLVTGD